MRSFSCQGVEICELDMEERFSIMESEHPDAPPSVIAGKVEVDLLVEVHAMLRSLVLQVGAVDDD